MPHPQWPISPLAFVGKTTKNKDAYTVSEPNIVLKAFYQLRCTISSVCIVRWQMCFPDAFHTAEKKGFRGEGEGEKKNAPSPPLLPCPSSFWSLKWRLSRQVPARAEENIDLLFRP